MFRDTEAITLLLSSYSNESWAMPDLRSHDWGYGTRNGGKAKFKRNRRIQMKCGFKTKVK